MSYHGIMTATRSDTPDPESPTPPDERLCSADRMQRRHCAYFHEKTGRCTQTSATTWQERATKDADGQASEEA